LKYIFITKTDYQVVGRRIIKAVRYGNRKVYQMAKGMGGLNLDSSSENTKSENLGVDIKGFMTRKSIKMPILGQPVD
jgi:hypothetical protein